MTRYKIKRPVLISFLLLLAAPALAQSGAATFGEEEIETPVAPAFIILGVSPTTIARPTTPRALSVEALSLVSASRDGFPQTYALQVSPYWLQNHPDLTFENYISASFGQALLHNLTFSVATTPESDLTPDSEPGIGLGIRSMWFVGMDTTALLKKAQDLRKVQGEENKLWADLDAAQDIVAETDEAELRREILVLQACLTPADLLSKMATAEKEALAPPASGASEEFKAAYEREKKLVEARQKAVEEYRAQEQTKLTKAEEALKKFKEAQQKITEAQAASAKNKEKMKSLAKEVQDALPQRGLAFETAFALGISAPFEEDRPTELSRLGAWVTASYRTVDGIELLGLLRVLENDIETTQESRFVDYGGRVVARLSLMTISAEVVRRTVHHDAGATEDSTRLGGVVEIPVNKDIKLNFSLAKDFKSRTVTGNTVIGVLGASFQFGKTPPTKF